ncbi:alpha-L-fucosidase [Streptomyces sp. NPDC097727]|uniref:alpha-L-fucosidase n=1 Tax=Streptomyces sp. NPDC097727 TaxID=3366092 RepID=UPI0038217924
MRRFYYDDFIPQFPRRTLRPALPGGAVPAGARHHVLTSKHHEGFALRDTKLSDRNAAGRSAGVPRAARW